ncbi:centromere protein R isoform X1 [Callorhinchus milii]|uniref:centromere protein R isoform X1 n=1 Tax=Callorhinchus milii TaxID=7868 RepID=UPI0004572F40|nr:centromere protein R isoform X1 [Callorhinchus milii]|eukprot:gi/632980618/ref/XP_007907135.1/ PREDICTED: centromere protein R isoform X2 [Callorhinchus milii]
MKPRRPVKRSLQLDKKREGETTPNKKLRRLSPAKYSPITGTHILSSFTSRDVGPDDTSTDAADLAVQAHRATTREQQHSEERDEFSALRSKVEASVSILKATREKLLCLWVSGENGYGHPSFGSDVRSRSCPPAFQASEGSRELEYVLGAWNKTGDLSAELQRNRKLVAQLESRGSSTGAQET